MESGEAAAARVAQPGNGKRTLSPEEPAVATPSVPLGDVLASARFNSGVLDPRTSDSDDGDAVLGELLTGDEDEDELLTGDEDEDLYDTDDSDSSDNDDSDIEFENDDEPLDQFGDGEAAGSKDDDLIQAPVEFLGEPARFATVESTAGFMLLRAGDAGQDGGGEITVHYRYIRFTRDQTGGPSVAVYSGAKLHPVRFLVPTHAAAEECAICYEVLERGLASWPRCSHVFHGECLEQLLVRGDQRCPLCRSELMNGKAPD